MKFALPSLRLIDAVVIAAASLLVLKGVHYLSADMPPPPAFARALVDARNDPAYIQDVRNRPNAKDADVLSTASVPAKDDKKTPPAEPPKPKPPAFEPVPLPMSASEKAILERLGERRHELKQRDEELEMRERLIQDAEKKLENRINDLKSLETKNQEQTGKKTETGEAAGLRNLVTMYEAMKPKDAARIFDRLSQDVLVPVVLQMNPKKMSEVLANMSSEAAERLTISLSLRAKSAQVNVRPQNDALPAGELPAIEGAGKGR